jgi:hypothetical protein
MLEPREIVVELPTFHVDQIKAWSLPGRFKAIRCGRRWGKDVLGEIVACNDVAHGKLVGWFAPDHKTNIEVFGEINNILAPVCRSSSRTAGIIRSTTGGRLDFWTLDNERAGRSRKYHRIIINEAAFTQPNMMDIWDKSIKPTLLDYGGSALVLSNTNGIDADNFFWRICNQPEHGFVQYHAPSHNNPYLPAAEIAKLEKENPPLVFAQEYLAEFVDWSGVAFFALDKLLDNGAPVEFPPLCECVFAVIDTATKTGREHDGTAVIYCAVTGADLASRKLVILDWDIIQIEGSLLEVWMPTVFETLEALTKAVRCLMGSVGAFIEDKNSGMVLLQQAARRGWPAHAIDSKLTGVGKDERAISVSGYVYRNLVKLSRRAYDKVTTYKGTTRNQLVSQIVSFRVGDKDSTRQDDGLDTFCYAIAIALGNQEGF